MFSSKSIKITLLEHKGVCMQALFIVAKKKKKTQRHAHTRGIGKQTVVHPYHEMLYIP